MNQAANSGDPLIPAFFATGTTDPVHVSMLLSYRGALAVSDGKNFFLPLSTAIRWNESEAADAGGKDERSYREALAAALRAYVPTDGPFAYTLELWALWARVFEAEARGLLKSRNAKIPVDVRDAVSKALR